MKSMTGFGRGTAAGVKGTVTAEIKTVNSRFLEINMRSDHFSAMVEESAKQLIKEQVNRGKMYVSLSFETAEGNQNISVSMDKELLEAYITTLKKIRKMDEIKDRKPSIADLLALPVPFLHVKKDKITDEELIPLVKEAVQNALKELCRMRIEEGNNLVVDLKNRLQLLQEKLKFLESKQEQVVADYEIRLRTRMKKLLDDIHEPIDERRFLEEVAIYSEKTDYTEELVRFGSHLTQFEAALDSADPVGRKLDFLLQELNREINTTASKASDIDVIDCVIMIKTELEKIREQVQNIE